MRMRLCSTQPQAAPGDKLLEEVVERRLTQSLQDTLRSEFSSLRTELNAKIEGSSAALRSEFNSLRTELNAKIEGSSHAMNAKIEGSSSALNAKMESMNVNFRQIVKDREVSTVRVNTFLFLYSGMS